jgi:hypothetical protein
LHIGLEIRGHNLGITGSGESASDTALQRKDRNEGERDGTDDDRDDQCNDDELDECEAALGTFPLISRQAPPRRWNDLGARVSLPHVLT